SYASSGQYIFDLVVEDPVQHGVIEAKNLSINNNTLSFKTVDQPYFTNMWYANFTDVKSSDANISNANFLLTPYFNYPQYYGIAPTYNNPGNVVVASYTYNDSYEVKTFQPVTFFKGTTETRYPYKGEVQTYSTETIYYQLGIDVTKTPNKAKMIMYQAKFTSVEQEPKKDIIIEDLDVNYDNGVITVSGKDVIPGILEGNEVTPYPSFTINNIEFKTTNADLTWATINFTVAGIYEGSFTGSYANTNLQELD
ncbi:MAG: hypothetical protein J1F43_08160, partial [Muribaculaceae bacterium]|nr:hypothetical protein [Muribaculaceae bacterium]